MEEKREKIEKEIRGWRRKWMNL